MKIALCNEVVRDLPIEAQFVMAAELGYDGMEMAPFTVAAEPGAVDAATRRRIRDAASAAGIVVSGLHWLLVKPEGLSITTDDGALWQRSVGVMLDNIRLCADLEGAYLVHGSPGQRRLPDEPAAAAVARERAMEAFARAGTEAERLGVTYCIEALAPPAANFITTVAEAVAMLDAIGCPALGTMIDCSSAGRGESAPVAELIAKWLPGGRVAHIHANAANRLGPGQGNDDFAAMIRAVVMAGYGGWIGVEPFEYRPDGPTSAARAIGYLRGLLEAVDG